MFRTLTHCHRRSVSAAFLLTLLFTASSWGQTIGTLEATLKLRSVDGVTVPFQNGMPLPSFEKQPRTTISLQGAWKKQRFAANHDLSLKRRDSTGYASLLAEATGRHLSNYNDATWETKSLPAVENTLNAAEQTPEYYEDGVWYRYTFDLPDSLQGRLGKLVFLGANYIADVWLNDGYLGYHEGGYTPFAFDATPLLRFDSLNVIAVRIDNPPWGTRKDIVPYTKCDWFNYTGIVHEAYLEFTNPVTVVRADVVPQGTDGTIQTTVTLLNRSGTDRQVDVHVEAFDAHIDPLTIQAERSSDLAGAPVALSGTTQSQISLGRDSVRAWRTTLAVPSPRLWSPGNPELYLLKVTVSEGATVLDEFYTQFGIRTVRTAGTSVLLNNRTAFFTGAARHEDHPLYGRSVPTPVIFSDLQSIKQLNVNFLRTGHYPNHPYTYLIADRLGIAVTEEIPVWWFDEAYSWQVQTIRKVHQQMWREMVFRDYSRPSVLLWSTCNECADVPNRQAFIRLVHGELDQQYPDGRLVTQSASADRPGYWDASQTECDVAGWTFYWGIFYGTSYYEGTRDFLANAHTSFPSKPLLATEFGHWSGETGWNEQGQVTVFNDDFRAFSEKAAVAANGVENPAGYLLSSVWWCAFDWYTCQQPSGYDSFGALHMNRTTEKPVAATMRTAYAPYFAHGGVTGVREAAEQPGSFALMQNYPNPFNPVTTIAYSVGQGKDVGTWRGGDLGRNVLVQLIVYDILGRQVKALVNEAQAPGNYQVRFDGTGLASGVYYYRLTAGRSVVTRSMILLK